MGFQTTASGGFSTAMGDRTQASGDISTAMGLEYKYACIGYLVVVIFNDTRPWNAFALYW